MNLVELVERKQLKKPELLEKTIPDFHSGDTVRVHVSVVECRCLDWLHKCECTPRMFVKMADAIVANRDRKSVV
jgi:ribosomal protein L19